MIETKTQRVVIRGDALFAAFRQFRQGSDSRFVGGARWNVSQSTAELLVDQVRPVTNAQPLDTYSFNGCACLVLFFEGNDRELNLRQLLSEQRHHFSKQTRTIAIMAITSGESANWQCGLLENEEWSDAQDVLVVGGRSMELSPIRNRGNSERSSERRGTNPRYSRLEGAIDPLPLEDLQGMTATIVGAGRSASLLSMQLASLGVARLRIADPDRMELGNLDAMPFHSPSDVGKLKVECLAKKIRRHRPDIRLSLFAKSIRSADAHRFLAERSDGVFTAVDDDLPRLIVARECRRLLMPHLDISTSVQRNRGERTISADVRLMLPGQGCLACVGRPPNLETLMLELNDSYDCIPRLRRLPWNQQRAGSLITINSMAVGAGVQMWLETLAGRIRNSFWQRIAWTAREGLVCNAGEVGPEPNCAICQSEW